jgi:hypothetical protein
VGEATDRSPPVTNGENHTHLSELARLIAPGHGVANYRISKWGRKWDREKTLSQYSLLFKCFEQEIGGPRPTMMSTTSTL